MKVLEETRRLEVEGNWRASVRILMRLRELQLRQLTKDAGRDPAALLCFLAITMVGAAGARRLFEIEPTSVLARFMCEAICCALVFATLARVIKSVEGEELAAGPFHVLLARRGRATSWLLLEAGAIFSGLVAWLTLPLLTLDPLRAPLFLGASLVGAGGAWTALRLSLRRTASGAASLADGGDPPSLRSLRGPLLVARLQWRRRIGLFPAWLGAGGLAGSGALATALAVRNNPEPGIACGVLGATGLVTGIVLASLDIDLLRFAGREPTSLRHLVGDFAVASSVIVAGGLLATGALAGLPLGLALLVALGVGAVIFIYSTVILLHALGGARRFPVFAAAIDLTIVLVIAVVFAPLAFVWTIVRGVMLARSAQRLRWRDS